MKTMVTEATFNEPEEVQPLRQRLEAAGIHTQVLDERRLQKYWFMAEPLAGVHLQVEKQDCDKAHRLLALWDAEDGALKHALHCPECGSSRLEFPQFTRKFVSPSIYGLLCKLRLFDRRFYCQECHYTWPLSEKLPPRLDLLGWPVKEQPAAKARQRPPG